MDYADSQGIGYDCVVLLQPTTPFRNAQDVQQALELFDPEDTDMVVSVAEAASNPYYNCFETDPVSGYLHISKGDGLLTRRQKCAAGLGIQRRCICDKPSINTQDATGDVPAPETISDAQGKERGPDTPLDWAVAEAILANQTNCQTKRQ